MTKATHVIYHATDMDGKCGGAILYKFLREQGISPNMIPHERGWPTECFDEIIDGDTVYIVDYSLSVAEMQKLDMRTEFIWLDHHNSIFKETNEADFHPKGLQTTEFSGCELAWKWCYPDRPMPRFVKMLGRFDAWDLSFSPATFHYNTFMNRQDLHPGLKTYKAWELFFAADETSPITQEVEEKGKLLYDFMMSMYAEDSEKKAFEMTFTTKDKEYSVLVCNGGRGSDYFHALQPENFDMLLTFYVSQKDGVKYSIYTLKDHIDVSVVAGLYGGGGHPGASGFYSKDLPWDLEGMTYKDKYKVPVQ